MSEAPVSLYDTDAGYNNFIFESVIPKILKIIEESGLSYQDAKRIPDDLRFAIDIVCENALKSARFKIEEQ